MQQPARTRFAVITFSIIAVSLGAAFLLLHMTSPSDGARLAPGEPDWRPDGVIVTPIKEQSTGLQQGDVVVAVEGSSIESWTQALLEPGYLILVGSYVSVPSLRQLSSSLLLVKSKHLREDAPHFHGLLWLYDHR